ncbi:MAG TPA: extracellular solute-binding protein, partial [Sphaerochaeta sp.]|nr:extracellular solute-binding protein [Sphaerochaeta sp.]
MKKTIFIALVLTGIFSFSLFAQAKTEKPSAEQPKTIIWWHYNSGLAGKATDAIVEDFNNTVGKEQNIRVQAVYQGKASDVLTKLKAIFQSGTNNGLPDLVQLDGSGVLDIRDNEYLISMEKLANQDKFDLSAILDSARLSVAYKDEMIAMPFNSSTIMLYYNKSAFDEVGILGPPRTLDELAQVATKLKKTDTKGKVVRYGFANVPTTYELIVWLGQQNGVSYLTDKENGHTGIPTKVL